MAGGFNLTRKFQPDTQRQLEALTKFLRANRRIREERMANPDGVEEEGLVVPPRTRMSIDVDLTTEIVQELMDRGYAVPVYQCMDCIFKTRELKEMQEHQRSKDREKEEGEAL